MPLRQMQRTLSTYDRSFPKVQTTLQVYIADIITINSYFISRVNYCFNPLYQFVCPLHRLINGRQN